MVILIPNQRLSFGSEEEEDRRPYSPGSDRAYAPSPYQAFIFKSRLKPILDEIFTPPRSFTLIPNIPPLGSGMVMDPTDPWEYRLLIRTVNGSEYKPNRIEREQIIHAINIIDTEHPNLALVATPEQCMINSSLIDGISHDRTTGSLLQRRYWFPEIFIPEEFPHFCIPVSNKNNTLGWLVDLRNMFITTNSEVDNTSPVVSCGERILVLTSNTNSRVNFLPLEGPMELSPLTPDIGSFGKPLPKAINELDTAEIMRKAVSLGLVGYNTNPDEPLELNKYDSKVKLSDPDILTEHERILALNMLVPGLVVDPGMILESVGLSSCEDLISTEIGDIKCNDTCDVSDKIQVNTPEEAASLCFKLILNQLSDFNERGIIIDPTKDFIRKWDLVQSFPNNSRLYQPRWDSANFTISFDDAGKFLFHALLQPTIQISLNIINDTEIHHYLARKLNGLELIYYLDYDRIKVEISDITQAYAVQNAIISAQNEVNHTFGVIIIPIPRGLVDLEEWESKFKTLNITDAVAYYTDPFNLVYSILVELNRMQEFSKLL